MDEYKKRLLLRIATSPLTLFCWTGGLSLVLLGWNSAAVFFAGLLLVLFGTGLAFTNLVFNKDKIIKSLVDYDAQQRRIALINRLHMLEKRVKATADKVDDKCLADLRNIYFDFVTDVMKGKVVNVPDSLLDQLDALFGACIRSLEHSCDLYEQANKLSSSLKAKATARREKIIRDVTTNIEAMFECMSQIRMMSLKDNSQDLDRIRKNVERSLRLAKEIDQICDESENTEPDYDDYIKQ